MNIKELLRASRIKLIALDDDPTGIQTVHGCLLLTEWSEESLHRAFRDEAGFFYVLTNTRAMTAAQAAETTRQAMTAILKVSRSYNFRLLFVSRSDSTLRGHFPLETDIMHQVLQEFHIDTLPLTFFAPAFIEVGRLSIEGVHYLKDGNKLIPVNETEFARDNVFAYHHANIKDYIAEKLGTQAFGYERFAKNSNLEDLQAAIHRLTGIEPAFISVDADTYADLDNFARCLLQWMTAQASTVVLRTSSSLPKALSGIDDQPLLDKNTFCGPEQREEHQGLFIVGSHVKKSTAQLVQLLQQPDTEPFELDVNDILHGSETLRLRLLSTLARADAQGLTPVVYTSRQELRLDNADERQALGQRISAFLVSIVEELPYRPAWLVAKGGITSHDILTKGLGVKQARVMGQILAGVPCIRTGEDARFAHLPYVIFPGNVGDENSLAEVYNKLR